MPSTIKDVISFRVTKFHALMLKSYPYKRYKGKLFRLLIEAYFNGEIPRVKIQFEKEIAEDERRPAPINRATG